MKKVAFLDEVHPILEQILEDNGFICDILINSTKDKILEEISAYEGLVVRSRFAIDEPFLKKASNLKFIARSGAGMENIDLEYCKKNSIALFNAPEGNRNAVGEHALGMLLALFNNLVKGNSEIRKGIWDREGNRGVELDGKTVGIIGYGNNGKAFAKKLAGFDVEVLAYDKYKNDFSDKYVSESSMENIFESVDIISLHIPQNENTIFLVDDEYLNKFRKPIYLINLSRGKIVRTKALLNGIENNKVLGACLDVLEYEKSSFENMFTDMGGLNTDFKTLLALENVLLSPHVGGWTTESYYKLSEVLAIKILNYYQL